MPAIQLSGRVSNPAVLAPSPTKSIRRSAGLNSPLEFNRRDGPLAKRNPRRVAAAKGGCPVANIPSGGDPTGNLNQHEVTLHDQVRQVYGPVLSWEEINEFGESGRIGRGRRGAELRSTHRSPNHRFADAGQCRSARPAAASADGTGDGRQHAGRGPPVHGPLVPHDLRRGQGSAILEETGGPLWCSVKTAPMRASGNRGPENLFLAIGKPGDGQRRGILIWTSQNGQYARHARQEAAGQATSDA